MNQYQLHGFRFFEFFLRAFSKIRILTLKAGNDKSSILTFELFLFFSLEKVKNCSSFFHDIQIK